MAVRKIVAIDEELCNGCGQCVQACAEGAIQLIDGKARLVKDDYCDGLGACLGECPHGAIAIIEREAAAFEDAAVTAHPAEATHLPAPQPHPAPAGGCPGAMMRQFAARPAVAADAHGLAPSRASGSNEAGATPSALRQWPVQLHLVSPTAPYFRDADLLLAADCTAFACGDFHARLLTDHTLAIACPKLDDAHGYLEKLTAMITDGGIRSITIAMMQVPCCRGLERLVDAAVRASGKFIPVQRVIVGIEGEILDN